MTRLNQIVAIEAGEKAAANKATAPLFHAAKNPAVFAGLTKTYEPVDEEGEKYPDESAKVQATVVRLLQDFAKASSRQLDLASTKETANTTAFADVKVGDQVIIEKAPVVLLIQLEKYLEQEVRGLVQSLPVLDPALDWAPSASGELGVSETPVIKRHKTKKVARVVTLAPPTVEHPAQVQMVSEDVVAGYWSEKKFSGATTAQRKQELLERVEKLINAVKFARQAANETSVSDKPIGAEIFGYLFA